MEQQFEKEEQLVCPSVGHLYTLGKLSQLTHDKIVMGQTASNYLMRDIENLEEDILTRRLLCQSKK